MSAKTKLEYDEFIAYCATLTDEQLIAVVHKEREGAVRDPDRTPHFQAAMDAATKRGLDWRSPWE